ncbi:7269_t:CDS:2 [Funneliformis mosseae]|uniref:7269_t:CDS:1 n=1 Tax=Funneliformis mosseae TaxID=27381 RepID=A0A9N9G9G4_FUNMO|nr:7269_t:CDS:2 [Funneliformis mosseae]
MGVNSESANSLSIENLKNLQDGAKDNSDERRYVGEFFNSEGIVPKKIGNA